MSETPSDENRDVDGGAPTADPIDGDPFEELADIDDPGVDFEEFFEEVETPEIDEGRLWNELFSEDEASTPEFEINRGGSDSGTEAADAVVDKERYCQRCEYFSEPPEVACSNPGTEIVELVGVGRFRLRDCPVVARRQRAETVLPDED